MTEHSPEAIAAYPEAEWTQAATVRAFREAYDRGAREKAAQQHAADKAALIEFVEDWYDRTAGPGESWTVADLADVLLAVDGPLADVREVAAKAWNEGLSAGYAMYRAKTTRVVSNPYLPIRGREAR